MLITDRPALLADLAPPSTLRAPYETLESNFLKFAAVGFTSFEADFMFFNIGGSLKLTGLPSFVPIDFSSNPVVLRSRPPVFNTPSKRVDFLIGLGLPARLGELCPMLADLTADRSAFASQESKDLGRFRAYSAASFLSSTL